MTLKVSIALLYCYLCSRLHEAEIAIVNDVLETKSKDVCDEVVNNFQDNACFALQILASIYKRTERIPRANEAERRALKLNPLLWKSFENLCQRGEFVDPDTVFSAERIEDLDFCTGSNHILKHANRAREFSNGNGGLQPSSGMAQTASNHPPAPRASLLATPSFPTRGSSTSTPILPISNVQSVPMNNPQIPQPVIFVTPLSEQGATGSEGQDSCFTA